MSRIGLPSVGVQRYRRLFFLGFIGLLFIGPLLLTIWVFYGGALQSSSGTRHGQLIVPARPLPMVSLATPGGSETGALFLRSKWSLLYVAADTCEQRCQAALRDTRSIMESFDVVQSRLQRVVLVDGACCARGWLAGERSDLVVGWLSSEQGRLLLAAFPVLSVPVETAGRIYLVDPQGDLVVSYPANVLAPAIRSDLDGLLRTAKVL